jgi:uncharacterized protein (DUF433 family)
MGDWTERIASNPEQCGGRPCIRGMRIRVSDILDLLASGLTQDQILVELPDLEPEDIEAAIKYTRNKLLLTLSPSANLTIFKFSQLTGNIFSNLDTRNHKPKLIKP